MIIVNKLFGISKSQIKNLKIFFVWILIFQVKMYIKKFDAFEKPISTHSLSFDE